METTHPTYVKVIKALAIYIFPAIIAGLLIAIAFVPAPERSSPRTKQAIEAEIQRLLEEKKILEGEK